MQNKLNSLNSLQRQESLTQLNSQKFDLIVIGGGITGVGIALDAANRGLTTALIEMQDFASGTSSRSTKLIHGGLRYLKQLEFKLVADVGKERAIVYNNAKHLVIPERMILPITENGTFGKLSTSFGLWFYDKLAKVKGNEKRKILSKNETVALEPLLNTPDLIGSGYYTEYRTDDARLTIEVAKTAATKGAVLLNYIQAKEFILDKKNKVAGVKCVDLKTNNIFDITSLAVVNATGPWVDDLRKIDNSLKGKRLHLTKGVHIVLDKSKLPLNHSVYFDLEDGRMMFAIPRGNCTYIGTTDTNYTGEKSNPHSTREDVNYILTAVNKAFYNLNVKIEDVKSTWSGLRPLIHEDGKSPSELSRKDEVLESKSGLISIAGGKLTGYRKMAEQVTNKVCEILNITTPCNTKNLKLSGSDFSSQTEIKNFKQKISTILAQIVSERDENAAEYLVNTYGKNAIQIIEHFQINQSVSLLESELWYCINFEGVINAVDYFVRRSGKVYFDIEKVNEERNEVINVLSKIFNWSETEIEKQNNLIDKTLKLAVGFRKEEAR